MTMKWDPFLMKKINSKKRPMPSNNVGFLKQFHENYRKNKHWWWDEDEEDDIQGEDEVGNDEQKKPEWSTKYNSSPKRSNKNQPSEVTSKSPVGRYRDIVENSKSKINVFIY